MQLADMNWMDVEKYLEGDDRLMLVAGACEQHGYLSLLTDVKIPMEAAAAASDTSAVPLAPPLNYGISPYFLGYAGSISLRASTFMDMLEDVVRSLYGQGFRRLLILNGHGGNSTGESRLWELAKELGGLEVIWYVWWESPAVKKAAAKYDLVIDHANWGEAFPFTRVCPLPDKVKTPQVVQKIQSPDEVKQVREDGVFSGPYNAPDEIYDELLDVIVKDILQHLAF